MFRLPVCAICIVAFSFLWAADARRIKRAQDQEGHPAGTPQTIIPDDPDIRARFPDGYTTEIGHGKTVYSGSEAYFRAHTGKHLTFDPMAHGVNAQVTGHGDEQKWEIVKLHDTSFWDKVGYETLQVGDHVSLLRNAGSGWFNSSEGECLDAVDGTLKASARHYGDSQKFIIEAAETRDGSETGFTFGQEIRLKALPTLLQLINGECRTPSFGPGTFDTISADCSACKLHCLNTTSCVAAECQARSVAQTCKLHKDPITQTEMTADRPDLAQHECWTKQAGKYLEVKGAEAFAKNAEKDASQVFLIERYSGIGGLYSSDLPEDGPLGNRIETLKHLGNAAIAVYNADADTGKMHWRNGWQPVHFQLEFSTGGWSTWSKANIQAGIFKHHDFPEVAIVSFRGTQSARSVLQDLMFSWSGPQAATVDAWHFYRKARDMPENKGVKTFYVTGHSLGGYLAESVASHENLQGVAFNVPGLLTEKTSRADGDHRPPFEVHLAKDDPVQAWVPGDRSLSHIARPKLWKGRCHCEAGPFFGLCGGFWTLETCEARLAKGGSRYT